MVDATWIGGGDEARLVRARSAMKPLRPCAPCAPCAVPCAAQIGRRRGCPSPLHVKERQETREQRSTQTAVRLEGAGPNDGHMEGPWKTAPGVEPVPGKAGGEARDGLHLGCLLCLTRYDCLFPSCHALLARYLALPCQTHVCPN